MTEEQNTNVHAELENSEVKPKRRRTRRKKTEIASSSPTHTEPSSEVSEQDTVSESKVTLQESDKEAITDSIKVKLDNTEESSEDVSGTTITGTYLVYDRPSTISACHGVSGTFVVDSRYGSFLKVRYVKSGFGSVSGYIQHK